MDKDLIRHFMTYQEYYRFIGVETKTIDEVQDYMLTVQKMNRNTFNHHLGKMEKNPGLFLISDGRISVDQKKLRECRKELQEIFGIPPDATDPVVENEIHRLEKEVEDLKNQLEKEKATRVLDWMQGKVLLTPSIEIGPLQTPTDEFFLDDPVYDLNPEDYKAFFGGVIDSYLESAADRKSEKELTVGNYQKKGLLQILTDRFLRKRRADKTLEAELSPPDHRRLNLATEDREKKVGQMFRNRYISIGKILNAKWLSNQQKLALFALYSDYHNSSMEKLINFAGDNNVDANLLIENLIQPVTGDSVKQLEEFLRSMAKQSEAKQRLAFARELIQGDWYIRAIYNGKETYFSLVPMEELNEIRQQLGLEKSNFGYKGPMTVRETLQQVAEESTFGQNVQKSKEVTIGQNVQKPKEATIGQNVQKSKEATIGQNVQKSKEDTFGQSGQKFGESSASLGFQIPVHEMSDEELDLDDGFPDIAGMEDLPDEAVSIEDLMEAEKEDTDV